MFLSMFSLGLFFQRSVTHTETHTHIDKKWQKGDRLLSFLYVSCHVKLNELRTGETLPCDCVFLPLVLFYEHAQPQWQK